MMVTNAENIQLSFESKKDLQKVKELYGMTRDVLEIRRAYKETKVQLKELATRIDSLKKEREKTESSRESSEIERLEKKYAVVFYKIEEMEDGKKNTRFSTSELLRTIQSVSDKHLKAQHVQKLTENSIYFVRLGDYQGNASEDGIALDRMLEDFLEEHKREKEIVSEAKKRIKEMVNRAGVIKGLAYNNNVCVVMVDDTRSTDFDDAEVIRDTVRTDFPKMFSLCPQLTGLVANSCKESLLDKYMSLRVAKGALSQCNALFLMTDFYVKSIEDWILDAVVKRIQELSKTERIDTVVSGSVEVSQGYSDLENALSVFQAVNSPRKNSAADLLSKLLVRFFRCKNLQEKHPEKLFLYFSDVSKFIERHKDCIIVAELVEIQESLFVASINESAAISNSLDSLRKSVLDAKVALKKVQHDFDENLRRFVEAKTQNLFRINFYELLYQNLINEWLLDPNGTLCSYTKTEEIADIIEYALSLSHNVDINAISSYELLLEHLAMIKK